MSTITYEDFFAIMKEAFEATQYDIAKCFWCSKSTITRIKQGKNFHFESSEIFEKVLDPQKSKLPFIKGRKDEDCLYVLKEIIKEFFDNVYEAMYDCWDEKDYKTFALRLLDRARLGTLQSRSEGISIIPDVIFVSSLKSYAIKDYLYSDLQNTLSPSYVSALDRFLDTIKDCLTDTTHFKKAGEQKGIKKFTKKLQDFRSFLLSEYTGSDIIYEHFKYEDFNAPDLLNTAFWDEAERMRKELLPLFEDVYKRAMENSIKFLDDYNDIILSEHPGKLD